MNREKTRRIILHLLPFLSIGLVVLGWVLFSARHPNLLATPEMVVSRIIRMFERPIGRMNVFGHIWLSLQRVLIALCFSLIIGVLLGTAMALSRTVKATLGTLYNLVRPIPPLAWVPMITVWFGIGELSKVILCFRGGLVPLTENSYTGVRFADQNLIDVGRVAHASRSQLLTLIILPAAIPHLVAGFKNALTTTFMVVLAAEMIGAQAGLGFLIFRGITAADPAIILVGMINIGIVGALLSALASYVEKITVPWKRRIK